jgi:hypothetical protein
LTRPAPPRSHTETRKQLWEPRPTLLRFGAPPTHWNQGATCTGLSCPAVQRSQAFSTSQRFAPPESVTALFHAASALGVFPSEVSPRKKPLRLPTPAPLLTLPPGSSPLLHSKLRVHFPFPVSRLQGFAPPASPFLRRSVLPSRRSRSSPGVRPLQGSPTTRDRNAFTLLPLSHSQRRLTAPEGLAPRRLVPQSLTHAPCG